MVNRWLIEWPISHLRVAYFGQYLELRRSHLADRPVPYFETKVELRSSHAGKRSMAQKNERVELEMKILKARQLARSSDDTTRERLEALAVELEKKLREMNE